MLTKSPVLSLDLWDAAERSPQGRLRNCSCRSPAPHTHRVTRTRPAEPCAAADTQTLGIALEACWQGLRPRVSLGTASRQVRGHGILGAPWMPGAPPAMPRPAVQGPRSREKGWGRAGGTKSNSLFSEEGRSFPDGLVRWRAANTPQGSMAVPARPSGTRQSQSRNIHVAGDRNSPHPAISER